jgi:hypothetical protein
MSMSDIGYDEQQLGQLLALPEDELYRHLAADVLGPQALPMDPRDLLDRGKRIFKAQRLAIQDAVCHNSRLRSFAEGTSDQMAVALEVLNVLASVVLPFSPVTLCALLVKLGLKNFCKADWMGDSNA